MLKITPSILVEFHKQSPIKHLISFIVVAFITLIQKIIWPWIDPAPFLLFYPAVIFASMYGDGLSAIVFSALSAQYFFIAPEYSFSFNNVADYIRMIVFIGSAVLIRMIINNQMHEKLKAESAVTLLTQREKDLEMERDTREKFVATLTHDLQTPLTAIKLNLQMAEKSNNLPEEASVKIGKAHLSLNRMQHLIQDLLDVNSIRAGKSLPLDIQECHLNQVVEDALLEMRQIHGERFSIIHKEEVKGHWSREAIRRIIENLCSNAVKYGRDHTPVKIVMEKGDSFIILQVHNEGNPIPEAAQKILFNPYERASEENGKKKGHGLGLTLVKGLAEAQGGKVIVTSKEELGTTFSVYLPLDAREHVSQQIFT